MAEVSQGLSQGAFSSGQSLLILHDLKDGGCAEGIFLLVGIERFALEVAGLNRGIVADACLLQTDHGILDIDSHLIDSALQGQFVLTDGQEIGSVVGLGGAVAQRHV